jgi:hypothetical protein
MIPMTPKRISAIIFVAALSSISAAGCGVKSAPVPPAMARPAAIIDLRAVSDPDGIKLSWARPTHYAGGGTMRDLGDFIILRGAGDAAPEPLVEIPVTDRERFSVQHAFSYVDGETALGQTYRYEVISRTLDGYDSAPSNNAVATREKPRPGPNPETFQLPTPSPLPTNAP